MLVKKTERKTQRNNFGTFFGWGFHYRTVFDLLNAVSPHSENAQEASALIETDLNAWCELTTISSTEGASGL
jgi:hypothetical protein